MSAENSFDPGGDPLADAWWDMDNDGLFGTDDADGLFGDVGIPELVGMTPNFLVPLTWAPPGNYPIGLIVQASSGVWSDPAFTAIMILPEPGTFTLLALGGLALWRRRRRGRA